MVRRRCRCIVVSDAGCDPDYGFEDLGNAVRKIAIDLGVYIRFDTLKELKPRVEGRQGDRQASITRSARSTTRRRRNGNQAAIRRTASSSTSSQAITAREGAGIVAYAKAHATFPHETTGDQFFSESQFESYRTLGFEIMDGVLKEAAENFDTITNAENR